MFDRLEKLISKDNLNKIEATKVLLVGVGGVGGYVLECLIRSGFIHLDIIDHDIVDITNLNRQIISNQSNIGQKKVEVARNRALSINPNIKIKSFDLYLDRESIHHISFDYDFIVDACDSIEAKVLLVEKAQELSIPIISCMGTANRIDPSKLYITTLNKTEYDPLAKKFRYELKKKNISLNTPVVFSKEIPLKQKDLGTIVMVPMVAGALCVSYLVEHILKNYKLKK